MSLFGITMGDPCGIGPEVILKSFNTKPDLINNAIVFGSIDILNYYNEKFKLGYNIIEIEKAEDFKMVI